jgi:hypothetical protein
VVLAAVSRPLQENSGIVNKMMLGLMGVEFLMFFVIFVLNLADGLCCSWFLYSYLVLVQVSVDRDLLYRLDQTE